LFREFADSIRKETRHGVVFYLLSKGWYASITDGSTCLPAMVQRPTHPPNRDGLRIKASSRFIASPPASLTLFNAENMIGHTRLKSRG